MRLLLILAICSLLWPGCRNSNPSPPSGEPGSSLVKAEESTDRDRWQNPARVIDQLGTLTGKTVADIGAGTGYFTFRLLPLATKVIAIEIDNRFVRYLNEKAADLPDSLSSRLEARLVTPDDPHLQNEEADVVLLVNTYIYMQNRIEYFRNLRLNNLRDGGHIVIVDFKKEPMKLGPPMELRMPPHQVEAELLSAGYTGIRVDNTTLPYQYMIRAEK